MPKLATVRTNRVARVLIGVFLLALAAVGIFLALILVAYFGGGAFGEDDGSCHGGNNQGYFWAMLAL